MPLILAAVLSLIPAAAPAADAVPTERDPITAARAMGLAEKLRCLVCQNQTIAESNAELALDLRHQISEQIKAGRSDREILDFMVARYGDFVLYQPPVKATTLLLWGGPALLLLIGFLALASILRARRREVAAPALSADEQIRVQRLLDGSNENEEDASFGKEAGGSNGTREDGSDGQEEYGSTGDAEDGNDGKKDA
jgi:cytochrome c-type biogenesis protein CcmH